MCKLISHHYIVRLSLVASIANNISTSKKNSFCQQRIDALEKGKFCLPQNVDYIYSLPMLEASNKLIHYINNFDYSTCKSINGFYKKRKDETMDQIMGSDNELHVLYKNHIKNMKTRHKNYMLSLKEKLELLLNNPNISNVELIKISKDTKDIIYKMYSSCHYDYVLGAITLLQIDYQLPRINSISMNNIKEALRKDIN